MRDKTLLRSEYAEYLFGQGTNFKAQEYLGAHRVAGRSFVFRVWAPNADMVYVCGDFNNWRDDIKMERSKSGSGIWAIILDDIDFDIDSRYKFIVERGGKRVFKADPYALRSEVHTGASSLFAEPNHSWQDGEYMSALKENAKYYLKDKLPPKPVNVYEVHLGSWKRHDDGSYLSYRELADELAEYAREMGYTHIELLPIAEHPFDGSWGYQICGYFAPTSRFGAPSDFMYFVDKLHQNGVGVILDWVPAHFPKDEHGLYEFDGSPLYEYSGKDRMEHAGWGTRFFDVARTQVQSFLISNALYWFEKYHIDGLRVDAVAAMLYLDFDRKPGEWNPNPDGSNISRESVAFFKKLNSAIKQYFPERCMIAEESTAFPGVTHSGGLGFTMKWNMGWMNDTLKYISADPVYRSSMHNLLNFAITYTYTDNYMLAISHDEVVHGKKSLVDKCFGDYESKFSTLRAYLTFMMTHPGKKLLFMGCEFAQFREWDYESSLEWFMLGYDKHSKFKDFVSTLNRLYITEPAMHELDCEPSGFKWIFPDNANDNVLVYERISAGGERVITAINFSGVDRLDYKIPIPKPSKYREILNSDDCRFGGKGRINGGIISGVNELKIKLPALSAVIIKEGE